MFDYDIENIISIQPKAKKSLSVFNNIQGYSSLSANINEYSDIKIESKPQKSIKQSLLEESLSNHVESGRILSSGITITKPELVCSIDFLPLYDNSSPTNILRYIDYSTIFMKYKEQQVQDILNTIINLDTQEAIELKNSLQDFERNLTRNINNLSLFFNQIDRKTNDVHQLRMKISTLKSLASLQEGSLLHRIVTSIVPNIDNVWPHDYNNTQLFTRLIAEIRRNLIGTSAVWDTNDTYSRLVENIGFVLEFDMRDSLSVTNNSSLSIYHFDLPNNSGIESVFDRVINQNAGLLIQMSRIRANVTLLTQELNLSKVIKEAISQLPQAEQETERTRNFLRLTSFGGIGVLDNPLLHSQINFSDNVQGSVRTLEYLAPEDEIFNYEEFFEKIIRLNDTAAHAQYKTAIDEYVGKYFSKTQDSITFKAFNFANNEYGSLKNKIIAVMQILMSEFVDDRMRNTINNLISRGFKSEDADLSLEVMLLNEIQHTFTHGAFLINPTQLFVFSLFALTASDGDQSAMKDLAKYICMLLVNLDQPAFEVSYGLSFNEKMTQQEKSLVKFVQSPNTSFFELNRNIAIRGIYKAISDYFHLDVSGRHIINFAEAFSSGFDAVQALQPVRTVELRLSGRDESFNVIFLEYWMFHIIDFLTNTDNGFLKILSTFFYGFSDEVRGITRDINANRIATGTASYFSNIEIYTLLILFFDTIRRLCSIISPIHVRREPQKVIFEIDTTDINTARLFTHANNISDHPDFKTIFSPLDTQFSSGMYLNLIDFVEDMKNKVLLNDFERETMQDAMQLIDKYSLVVQRGNQTAKINLQTSQSKLLDQIATLSAITQKYKNIFINSQRQNTQVGTGTSGNLEYHITDFEKEYMKKALLDNRALIIGEQIQDIQNNSTIPNELRHEVSPASDELLIVGIPVGFRNYMNKLFYEQQGVYLPTIDPQFSKINLDVYTRQLGFSNTFDLLKRAKFDIDYFVDTSHFVLNKNLAIDSLNIKLFSRDNVILSVDRSFTFGTTLSGEQASPEEIRRQTNEVMSHMLKKYIQTMYGLNLDENLFYEHRNTLNVENVEVDSVFLRKFTALVDSYVNKKLNVLSAGQTSLARSLDTFIKLSGQDNPLSVFSNDIKENVKRAAINRNLTKSEQDLKIELEDAALKIASVFRLTESIDGGTGFFKRLLAPKLFEKIIVIDVPSLQDDMNEYYVKITMDVDEANT